MKFTLSFDMDNAAFERKPATETIRILHDVAKKVSLGESKGKIRDINGNTVGTWEVSA